MTMKRHLIFLVTTLLLTGCANHAQRDRRADLNISCKYHVDVSTTGRLWIGSSCGELYTADSIGASWRTLTENEDEFHLSGGVFERVAAFGDDIAVAAGYMNELDKGYVLRTTTAGALWDTVQVDSNLVWVHGFCYHADGRMWMAAASGRTFKCMAYSTDRGRTFTTLATPFDGDESGEGGIEELYMVTADSGFACTYSGDLYSTADNWRTVHHLFSPLDQGLLVRKSEWDDFWVTRIRPWHGHLLATQGGTTAITPMGDKMQWQTLPFVTYEVDTANGNLWAINDSGQLLYLTDLEQRKVMAEGLPASVDICGLLNGSVYLSTPQGVVRVAPNGHADTCGFFTEEVTIEEELSNAIQISHGGRLWCTDGASLYLQDALGWYRIAKPLNISEMHPDPDHRNRILILRDDGHNYSVDTHGHIAPYTYRQPLAHFLESGLQSMKITIYEGGCFHYKEDTVAYNRQGDQLQRVGKGKWKAESGKWKVSDIEEALRRMGEVYDRFPTPEDFGLREGDVDLQKVFLCDRGWCTSSVGYHIVFLNRAGDTLTVSGNSDIDCGNYFPWLLPMTFKYGEVTFVTHQPLLWKALKPLMPKDMKLRRFLSNSSLFGLQQGDLLFYRDTAGMGAAVQRSTGEYTHVALVENVGDTVWIIDATQRYGVSRRPLLHGLGNEHPLPDVYTLDNRVSVNIDSVLFRARAFIGQSYDDTFLPNNGKLYCSELIYECFRFSNGKHIFKTKPMNWRDKEGNLPEYWDKHFKELGMPVPEGVPGTNPWDLSQSPLLKKR